MARLRPSLDCGLKAAQRTPVSEVQPAKLAMLAQRAWLLRKAMPVWKPSARSPYQRIPAADQFERSAWVLRRVLALAELSVQPARTGLAELPVLAAPVPAVLAETRASAA